LPSGLRFLEISLVFFGCFVDEVDFDPKIDLFEEEELPELLPGENLPFFFLDEVEGELEDEGESVCLSSRLRSLVALTCSC
jgi:hypothetical protein